MAYRTEMGLYYSYYKTLVTAPTYFNGLYQLTHDNITEYGHTINTLKRFNLYPEVRLQSCPEMLNFKVFLGAAYRIFDSVTKTLHIETEKCWTVNRGEELSPVNSCEGIGNQHYFYVDNVFALFGTVAASLFFLGVLLSDSVFGGLLTIASFFFNHGEATRVQWTPPLRESFGYPVFIFQILIVTFILRRNATGMLWSFTIAVLTTIFMLFWQFSGFALSTQVGSLFATYILDFVPASTMFTIVLGLVIGFICGFGLLFGNEMLLTSLFLSSTVTFLIILSLDRLLSKIKLRPLYLLINAVLFVAGTLGIKISIGRALHIEDDAHIFDIFRSKFSDFANFHTRLYTCAKEFDFLGSEYYTVVAKTLVLPAAIMAFIAVIIYIYRQGMPSLMWRTGSRSKEYSELVYNCVQTVCFAIMAELIMRLKLFFTPHLCVIAAILAHNNFLGRIFPFNIQKWYHRAIIVGLIASMAYSGVENLNKQWNIHGEYSNPDQEMLFQWITEMTPPDAVFAGTMPVMANVKLSTNRPIVNHPHYEDANLRERTLKVYSLFSKKPIQEVYQALKDMGVNYFVYQNGWCMPHPQKPECSYRSMWDLEDPKNKDRESLCDIITGVIYGKRSPTEIYPITVVYNSNNYIVFKL
uniref:C-mannosyltransferase dpy-19 n=1 Tax=Syphacia muris TaxID=451379 RepID=A0A0N5A8E4_9BILA